MVPCAMPFMFRIYDCQYSVHSMLENVDGDGHALFSPALRRSVPFGGDQSLGGVEERALLLKNAALHLAAGGLLLLSASGASEEINEKYAALYESDREITREYRTCVSVCVCLCVCTPARVCIPGLCLCVYVCLCLCLCAINMLAVYGGGCLR